MAKEIWRIKSHPNGGTFIFSDESPLIATVHDLWQASLIAAAPDLLAALEMLVESDGATLEHALVLANEAIAKAK